MDARAGVFDAPALPEIHHAVLRAAARATDSLDMKTWHTCDTTHCRAGWVVKLAGAHDLEILTCTPLAALAIYHVSSPIKVPLSAFFVSDEEALADMRRCAEEEKALASKTPR